MRISFLCLISIFSCILWRTSQLNKYDHSESGTIVIINSSGAIFGSNGYSFTKSLTKIYNKLPIVIIGTVKYNGLDQMTQ
jgi:hypothetical protein